MSFMSALNRYYNWVTKSPGLVSFGFMLSILGLIMFIGSRYGLKHVESNSTEKGISVFGDQLIYLLMLHVLVSGVWSIARVVRRVFKGTYEYEYDSKTFHEVSVLVMPFTIILILLCALVYI